MRYFVAILIFVLLIAVLIKFGRKLLQYKPDAINTVNNDLLEELKNIQSIKIDVVPARELYSAFVGNLLLFFAYYLVVSLIGALISNTLFLPDGKGVIYNAAISALFLVVYLIFAMVLLWQFTFFAKAILPNLKHKEEIIKRLTKFAKIMGIAIALPIWISAAIHVDGLFEKGTASGTTMFGYFVGAVLLIVLPLFTIKFELQRLGLPNLLENIQTLLKNRSQQ